MAGEPILNLKLNQLRLIGAIAEHGQLRLAAEMLAITQPAASRMLAEIERVVGAPLFARHPKGMGLTPLGQVIARRAHEMAVEMRDLSREVRAFREGRGGEVAVGAVTGPAVGYLVPAIRRLRAEAPEVEVRVDVAPSATLVRGLSAADYDFVLGRPLPESDRRAFELRPAWHEWVSFLVRREHPLAARDRVGLADLREFDWIIQERGTPIRTAVDEALSREGLPAPPSIVSTSSLVVMIAFLSQTDAVAPMAREVTRMMTRTPVSAGFVQPRLARDLMVSPYYIIRARGRALSPAALRLLALVEEELDTRAPEGMAEGEG
ncbi:LysR family transcriptional regulator [Amaricoccus solimangrovi]|uniref:LysR family transcriptional regulator n=1 Tax=Amaricoccus solimangrovi TaxID=2589815 RepID=A0A501WNH0_9RHOB|nr:LysR family transcriptional regulator [Amaricoccus solimangrovi]TPE48541.1 LysR family transcriptional regulator [Amaricoccus solimangrovi]